jgi:adenosylmethionine-8-amino-7-oxononanoate aminotransferase
MRRLVAEHGSQIAALVVEPMCQGAAGMRIYSANCLREMRRLCDQHGILLIADEIAMGMGRTGRMFAYEHAEIDPDIVCLGKGLTGGYLPMSAAVVKRRIYEAFADAPEDHTFYHGHTFAGNPIAAAAALECLRIYREDAVVERAAAMGEVLQREMQIFSDSTVAIHLRCLGMLAAMELEDTASCQRVRKALLREGILLRPLGNVVYLMLPLITPEPILRETVAALYRVIAANE